nr:ABC transporter substrate-binding protein [Pseudooceanicola aestuarii]
MRRAARLLALLITVAAAAGPGRALDRPMTPGGQGPAAPGRVVSINLCTDQLAMLLAAPGQLLSVSALSRDPRSSVMAAEARAYPVNHGRAEEIWLMEPDLVIAGSFSNRASVAMLRRLGVPVVVIAPAYSLADVPDRLAEMGAALGRREQARAMIHEFESRLATLRARGGERPRAALYHANGYASGDRTLAGQVIAAAGFTNIAAEVGLPTGGHLPLEVLTMAAPDMVITGRPHPGAARAEEILHHPALQALRRRAAGAVLTDRDWICGTPHVLDAVARMRALRQGLVAE